MSCNVIKPLHLAFSNFHEPVFVAFATRISCGDRYSEVVSVLLAPSQILAINLGLRITNGRPPTICSKVTTSVFLVPFSRLLPSRGTLVNGGTSNLAEVRNCAPRTPGKRPRLASPRPARASKLTGVNNGFSPLRR